MCKVPFRYYMNPKAAGLNFFFFFFFFFWHTKKQLYFPAKNRTLVSEIPPLSPPTPNPNPKV
jgi:hypothetical protein